MKSMNLTENLKAGESCVYPLYPTDAGNIPTAARVHAALATPVNNGPGAGFGNVVKASLRGPGYTNWEGAVVRSFKIYRETDLQFGAEYFNVLNHTLLSNPEIRTTNPNFGTIQSLAGTPYQSIVSNVGPRIAQFALKYTF